MKFTYTSLPKLNYFFSAFDKLKDEKEIFKPWLINQNDFELYSCSAISLYFIIEKISKTTKSNNICFWIPDYFCNSSLEAVRDLNIEFVFYPIKENFAPDIKWCENNIDSKKTNVFLFVHYFGYIFDLKSIRVFCDAYNFWLIEDAAHVFLPTPEIGLYGDFVMYSPHKHLPIFDGAILIITKNGNYKLKKLSENKDSINCLNLKSKYPEKVRSIIILKWVVKRLIQKAGFRSYYTNYNFWPDYKKYTISFQHIKISKISKLFLQRIAPDLNTISAIRIKNCDTWLKKFNNVYDEMNSVMSLNSLRIPYMAFFEVKDITVMKNIYYELKKGKFPVTSWPDLPPELSRNERLHSVAIGLRKNRIYFHIHHGINSNEIDKIISKIKVLK